MLVSFFSLVFFSRLCIWNDFEKDVEMKTNKRKPQMIDLLLLRACVAHEENL